MACARHDSEVIRFDTQISSINTAAEMPKITGGIDVTIFKRYAELIEITPMPLGSRVFDALEIEDITTAIDKGVVIMCNKIFTG